MANVNQKQAQQQAKAAESAQQAVAEQQATEQAQEGAAEGAEQQAEETVVQDTGAAAQDAAQVAGARGVVSAPKLVSAIPEAAAKVPPAAPKVDVAVLTSKKVDFALIDSEVARILGDVPAINRMQISGIVSYAKKCDPSQLLSTEAIANASTGLWNNLRLIICNETDYFEPVFTAALKVFELAAKGAMGEVYLYRAVDQMKLSKDDLKAYCDVTTMMRVLAPVKSRKAVLANGLSLSRSLRNGLTQDGINRVVSYFDAK